MDRCGQVACIDYTTATTSTQTPAERVIWRDCGTPQCAQPGWRAASWSFEIIRFLLQVQRARKPSGGHSPSGHAARPLRRWHHNSYGPGQSCCLAQTRPSCHRRREPCVLRQHTFRKRQSNGLRSQQRDSARDRLRAGAQPARRLSRERTPTLRSEQENERCLPGKGR
jgi:hypothetical protein